MAKKFKSFKQLVDAVGAKIAGSTAKGAKLVASVKKALAKKGIKATDKAVAAAVAEVEPQCGGCAAGGCWYYEL